MRKYIILAFIACGSLSLFAQPENWFNGDAVTSGTIGVGTEKAYKELLKGKKSQTILVAVLDSGIDIEHEDLKDIIWTNPNEIEGDGIDNDKNGYIDDIHGWNFLGGKDGKNVTDENLELTRVYRDLRAKYFYADPAKLSGNAKKEYAYYQKVEAAYTEKLDEAAGGAQQFDFISNSYHKGAEMVKAKFNIKEITAEKLAEIEKEATENPELMQYLKIMGLVIGQGGGTEEGGEKWLEKVSKYYGDQVKYNLNLSFDPRAVVGDDYRNSKQRSYGNADVKGDLTTEEHGTHVSGIIGAIRNNNKGVMGVADNVRIMAIRCVPNGDERDKDVANAIRYAVDNGAKILNMSFGKNYKFDKKAVDEAVKYAEKKGVLLVHAAGNDAYNCDEVDVYPNPKYGDNIKTRAKNMVTVGASNWESGEKLSADFSNWGKEIVDIYAPGVDIMSTVPNGKYEAFSGTSMASPCFAGCAALLWSYYPNLSMAQVKDILLTTGTPISFKVTNPGNGEMVPFTDLCKTGKVVNVYNALKAAADLSK